MRCFRNTRKNRERRGAILVLSAFMLIVLLGMIAFAVDLGYLSVARSQLQRSADAAAIAAAWQLVDEEDISNDASGWQLWWRARESAGGYVGENRVMGEELTLGWSDVAVGELNDFSDHDEPMNYFDASAYNAVRVRLRKSAQRNGELALFFGRVFGRESQQMEVEATAALLRNVSGFVAPPEDGKGLGILPFALDEQTWNAMLAGNADDDWGWDAESETVGHSGDGVLDVNLFPQGTGSPGNRGTVDLGGPNNSTQDLRRQILEGLSAEDLEHLGGSIELDENGELLLGADPGISAGMKSALQQIIGEKRVIPLFRDVEGNGNNAQYTIVGFAGVRVMDVKLTGSMSSKRLIVQPANVFMATAIANSGGTETSDFVFSRVRLVR